MARRLGLALLLLEAACAGGGPYRKNYKPLGDPAAPFGRCEEDAKIVSGSAQELEKQGYAAVGYVSFNALVPDPTTDPAVLEQAAAVGACRVLLSSNRSGERSTGFGGARHDGATYEVSAIFFRKRVGR